MDSSLPLASILTPEQKKRIEENYKKAMARKLESQRLKDLDKVVPTKVVSTITNVPVIPAPVTFSLQSHASGLITPGESLKPVESSILQSAKSSAPGSSFSPSISTPMFMPVNSRRQLHNNPSTKPRAVRLCKTNNIVAVCSLISSQRFKIELPYNESAIKIFKTVTGNIYDFMSKTWSFPIDLHDRIMSSLQSLKNPDLVIQGIPDYVLQHVNNDAQLSLSEPDLTCIEPVLLESLMPSEKAGVIFGIRNKGRLIIADEAGLDKTKQALAIGNYYKNEFPLLIICNLDKRQHWLNLVKHYLPFIPESCVLMMESNKDSIESREIVIASYDVMRSVRNELDSFRVIILDQSESMKNPDGNFTKRIVSLLQQSNRVVLLSETPFVSRAHEILSQISAVNPTLFSRQQFEERYCNVQKKPTVNEYSGCKFPLELNTILCERTLIRRTMSNSNNTATSNKRCSTGVLDTAITETLSELSEPPNKILMRKIETCFVVAANQETNKSLISVCKDLKECSPSTCVEKASDTAKLDVDKAENLGEGCQPHTTGILGLDFILDGGLIPGEFLEIFGHPNVGKTQFALRISSHYMCQGKSVAYFDLSKGFSAPRLLSFCNNDQSTMNNNIHIMRPENVHQIIEALDELHMNISRIRDDAFLKTLQLIVIDSIPFLMYSEGNDYQEWKSTRQALGGRIWNLAKAGLSVVLLNHSVIVGQGGDKSRDGPVDWVFQSSHRICLMQPRNETLFHGIMKKSIRTEIGRKFAYIIDDAGINCNP